MPTKRLISDQVLESDGYLSLSMAARALYPAMVLHADDYGFVNNAAALTRMHGVGGGAVAELEQSGFIIECGSVHVIAHWMILNEIRPDRRRESVYQSELEKLLVANGVYIGKDGQ
jgi:hypothetical protein